MLKKRLEKDFSISPEAFDRHRQAIKDCCMVIDIDRFVKEFPGVDEEKLHDAIHDVIRKESRACIFDDVIPFFERHKDTHDILIETHGDRELQKEKIGHSGLPEYIPYLISLEPKETMVKKYIDRYKKIYFIDDKVENIDAVKTTYRQVSTYLIERPEDSPYGGWPSECECVDYRIEQLNMTI
jgi:hypothetical protein